MNETERGREMYKEEAAELLSLLEQDLLELEDRPSDKALIGGIFRSLHTIKGSGAMFGFDEIASAAHEVETLFDDIREGRTHAGKEIISLTLKAVDRIKRLLSESDGRDASPSADILTKTGRAATNEGRKTGYVIKFRPSREIFLRGIDPLRILGDIRSLGECSVKADTEEIPPLGEINPEHCYMSWDIRLKTALNIDAIKDAVLFVEDDCEIAEEKRPADGRADGSKVDAKTETDAVSSVRVKSRKLDRLMDLVGELVTVQARLGRATYLRRDSELQIISEMLERLTGELRDGTVQLRMVPMGTLFGKLRRLVRDLSNELGKDVEFKAEGADTELDKSVIEKIGEFLVHIIRNSVGHGIETPKERERAGKDREGLIQLSAVSSGANVLVRVLDDGRGIDPEAVRARAVERGLISEGAGLSGQEVISTVFAPGFSTSENITNVSGRGVGLDVVKKGVEALRGAVEIESKVGEGTAITLRLPLTLAIIEGLLVDVAKEQFVIPLHFVEECIDVNTGPETEGFNRVVNLRGDVVPYIRLRELFSIGGKRVVKEQAVVCMADGARACLVVDRVAGESQVVIKPLAGFYGPIEGISGATILGNGRAALIIDVDRLVRLAEKRDAGYGKRADLIK